MSARPIQQIPRYFLYGDTQSEVETDFLHIEPIRDRSGPHDWRIQPHTHPGHTQILCLSQGGGEVDFEGEPQPLPVPCLIVIPAGVVHRIDFTPGTDGHVITAALPFLRQTAAVEPGLAEAAQVAAVYGLTEAELDAEDVASSFRLMLREFLWQAPARRAAIVSLFLRVLVTVARARAAAPGAPAARPDRDHDLVLRYRALLEAHFRHHRALGFYAGELAVTPARLTAACKARAGGTALDLLHERMLVEAKRYLLYTDMSVAQAAHLSGFDDPAYFSRFFTQRAGQPPGAFRRAAREGAGSSNAAAAASISPVAALGEDGATEAR